MPAFNAQEYITHAINSILCQTFKQFELIIIDDKSSDNTWKIIKSFTKKDKRIIAIRNKENVKLSKTLNIGIKEAKGTYIARMDADDWSYPDRLEKQLVFMENNPEIGIVGGTMEIVNVKGETISFRKYPLDDQKIRHKIFLYSQFCHPLIMIRKSILMKS